VSAAARALRPCSALPFDTHLMIGPADPYIPAFAEAGSWMLTVHLEACRRPAETIRLIKKSGCRAGMSVLVSWSVVSTVQA